MEHREIVEPPDSDFPLILTTGRILWHYHSRTMTGRVDGLQELVPKAYVEINPADAQALGIEEGRKVRVSSRRGSIVIRAKITERVPRGLVFIPFHFGEAAANVLTPASPLDPLAKMPSLKCCAVRVEPAEG